MKFNFKKLTIAVIILAIITFTGLKITKRLLYHPYNVTKFGTFDKNKDVVIVFHGIYGKAKTLNAITDTLEKEGYSGINIQYPTTEDTVEKITEKYIAPNVESVIKTVEEENVIRRKQRLPEIKINFIVHSMGTGVLRYYLKTHKLNNLGKVVFISPPSHGSQLSDNPISDIIKDTLGDAVKQFKTSSDSFINSLGEPDYQCYVMIGNKSGNFLYSILIPGIDDGMVPFKTSRLNNCNYKVIENATHTSILEDKRTLNEIADYLKN
ncbi:lipase [Leptotrichia sp. oral taxon 215]|uniref:alpha/beta hydrolase n=1 Tax=Leptotrichia sp. oral taxon 215 TaxID=712359 RepID=UPI0004012C55|nr:lipase [Leptotrichia sp. oral taxon 215]